MSKYCPKCGNQCNDNDTFCGNCGQRFAVQQPQKPLQPQNPQRPVNQPNNYRDNFNRPVNTPPQNNRPLQGYYPPQNGQVIKPVQPKKSHAGLITGIICGAVVLVVAIIVGLILLLSSCRTTPPLPPLTEPTTTAATTAKPEVTTQQPTTQPATKAPQPTTQPPTKAPKPTDPPATQAPKPKPTDPPKPDYSNVGKPSDDDFSGWFLRATMEGAPASADLLFTGEQVSGDWKALFYYSTTSVFELKNVEILAGDRAATVYLDHYKAKTDASGYHDDSTPTSTLEGAINNGEVTAFGVSGNLDLYVFYEYNGKQYAIGKYTNPSGETAEVGLVRP